MPSAAPPGLPKAEEESLIFRVQFVAVPLLVAFGAAGNALSLMVFRTPAFRAHSSSWYLAALAASDTLFLLNLLAVWAATPRVGVDVFHRAGGCQAVTFLSHVAAFVSVWLVVAFTVERFVAVCYPLLRSAVCTVRRAKAVVGGLVALALCLYAYLLAAAGVERSGSGAARCTLREGYAALASAMNAVDTALTLVVPVVAVVTLNARIARCVYAVDRFQRRFAPPAAAAQRRKSHHGVTKMLLVISTVFILLNLPSYTLRVYVYFVVRRPRGPRRVRGPAPEGECVSVDLP